MRTIFFILLLVTSVFAGVLVTSAVTLAAGLKIVVLSVDNMACNMCSVSVEKALQKSDRMNNVSVKYEADSDPDKVKSYSSWLRQ